MSRTGSTYLLAVSLMVISAIEPFAALASVGHEIIAIEKNPDGLYVATSEHRYAFTHPDLSELSWFSVSVKDGQVVVVKQDNSSSLESWDSMDEADRDFISDLRSDFIANLASLKLTDLPISKSPKASYRLGRHNRERYDLVRMRQPWPPSTMTGYLNKQQPELPYTYPPLQLAPAKQQRPAADHRAPRATASKKVKKVPGRRIDNYARKPVRGLNYFNLNQSELRKKLTGDVYHFDMSGNILDIFSSTISIRLDQRRKKSSVLYRDEHFLSYCRNNLPLGIRRLFIQGDVVFFVYEDSSVLAKSIHSLGPKEKKLVHKVIAKVKKLSQWQTSPPRYVFSLPDGGSQEASSNNSTMEKPYLKPEQKQEDADQTSESTSSAD